MKSAGLEEVQAALRRVKKLNAMGRVGGGDLLYIVTRLEQVEYRIKTMKEASVSNGPSS